LVRANVVPTAIYAGAGNDRITVASAGGSLAAALGAALQLWGDADSDILDVADLNAGAGGTYTLTSTAIYVGRRQLLAYGAIDDLRLTLTNRPDKLNITGNPYPALVSVNGGGDSDTLTGSNAVNLFLIQGPDSGLHTYGTTSYASFENLLGGSGIDRFVFQGGTVSGTIRGGDGTDTLNYAAWTDPVQVSLLEERAPAVGGGTAGKVSGIENVMGGAGADELIGDNQANALSGGGGADTLVGGDGQDLLIGGFGIDVLRGGLGEDLLIGGNVFVPDPVDYGRSLTTLRDHWAQTDAYFVRIELLRNDLIATPVEEDADSDQLWGQGNRDWFWGALAELRDREDNPLEILN
jgi:Ca2+-binding RTX toxin-like protein